MSKMHGPKACFVPIREDATQVIISYDKVADGKKNAYWHEVYFNKNRNAKPSLEQIKAAVIADIDARTDEKSEKGYVWQGKPVTLNWENRQNFKAVHDAAAMYPEQVTFPKTFKLGTDENGADVYHQFESMDELAQFYLGGLAWIEQCVEEGWQKKATMDWSPYEPEETNP